MSVFSTFLMPVVNVPQQFVINMAGVDYLITCKWNDSQDAGWIFDIADNGTGAMLAANIPLITGIDLLSGLEYLGIGGSLVVYTNGGGFSVPTIDNLGVESNVYFVTSAPNG